MIRIGVDVGGTNTDSVILKENLVLGWVKNPTTSDVTEGLLNAINGAINEAKVSPSEIQAVMIGTTHFVNAVLQQKDLSKVAVLRLCGPSTRSLPPFCDFPNELKNTIFGISKFADGGFEFDGSLISELNELEIRDFCQTARDNSLTCFAVTGVFGPMRTDHEVRAKEIILEEISHAKITLSHQVSGIGLVERENATILNACLLNLAEKTITGFKKAFENLNLNCPLYLSQNDGTLMNTERAMNFPILTFSSGPTNSMKGASFLSGIKDSFVIDVGGTSSDIGMISHGFPTKTNTSTFIAGVKTNFRMPNVNSVGLGGGSRVNFSDPNNITVGPLSVGYRLTEEALVFGGKTLTASDIAVAAGLVEMGDKKKVQNLPLDLVEKAVQKMVDILENELDFAKQTQELKPCLFVGGGSVLFKGKKLKGVSEVIFPEHFFVANAIGSAIAQCSGEVNKIVAITDETRDEVIKKLKQEAKNNAVNFGAIESTVEIIDIEEMPLSYVPGGLTHFIIKAVGDLDVSKGSPLFHNNVEPIPSPLQRSPQHIEKTTVQEKPTELHKISEKTQNETNNIDVPSLPFIDENGFWIVSENDLEFMSIGAGMLGAGGGGSPYYSKVRARNSLREGKKITIIPPSKLKESDSIFSTAQIGAPTVMIEKVQSGMECPESIFTLEKFVGKKATAIISGEIGGLNSIEPMLAASICGIPLVDADGIGRAFPEVQMVIWHIYGHAMVPSSMADEKGNSLILTNIKSAKWLENLMRGNSVSMGCAAGLCFSPLTSDKVWNLSPLHTMSKIWRIGHAVKNAQKLKQDPTQAILKYLNGTLLCTGKIIQVDRWTEGGFARGKFLAEDLSKTIYRVDFQNENIVAFKDKQVVASVPDIIQCVDTDKGEPITTEELRYGMKVSVVILPCHPLLKTPKALNVVGPKAFGYDHIFTACGNYLDPVSVFEEHEKVKQRK